MSVEDQLEAARDESKRLERERIMRIIRDEQDHCDDTAARIVLQRLLVAIETSSG